MKDLLRRREGHALRRNAPKNYSILMGPQRDFACVMVPCGANDTQNAVTLDSALRITHSALAKPPVLALLAIKPPFSPRYTRKGCHLLRRTPQFHFPLSTFHFPLFSPSAIPLSTFFSVRNSTLHSPHSTLHRNTSRRSRQFTREVQFTSPSVSIHARRSAFASEVFNL